MLRRHEGRAPTLGSQRRRGTHVMGLSCAGGLCLWSSAPAVEKAFVSVTSRGSAAELQAALRGSASSGAIGDASSQQAASSSLLSARASSSSAGLLAAGAAATLAAGLAIRTKSRKVNSTPRRAEDGERKLTDRQEQFWEMLVEDLDSDVSPEFGRENLDKVYEFVDYCKYEKDIPKLPEFQEVDPEYFPGLTAKPFWEPEEVGDWVEKVRKGLPFVQGELADLLEDDEEALLTDSVQNDVMGSGWSGFRLQRQGSWIQRNCDRFPRTVQLLRESGCPVAMRGVIVARQAPRSRVAPHSDGRNCFLTAHFGLSVPENCEINVANETREWIDDGVLILDTSFRHSTKNDSDEDRFVLLIDFWHPDLTVPEQEAMEYVYDFRTKFEQGKIKYVPKLPKGFFETLNEYAGWGGAYTEESEAYQNKDDK
eukprot:TRINITY_DN22014_c0_g1_i11.p1 TRINITY_DN22014_c0_g1~~TRINITY_DN22014_c0_g1_i11.p1  ORF type:complete len:425 (+),score=95.95 TRINITY_DN22014_c0_g1_i11:161-1435(+)